MKTKQIYKKDVVTDTLKQLLIQKGYANIDNYYLNGTDISHFIHRRDLDYIRVESGDIDTEILLDILGVDYEDFEKMSKDKDEDTVLRELIKKKCVENDK
jgi:hypothetical protein